MDYTPEQLKKKKRQVVDAIHKCYNLDLILKIAKILNIDTAIK